MRIALSQMTVIKGEPEANLARAASAVRRAADAGCNLILLPEFWAVGFDIKRIKSMADPLESGVFAQMCRWARDFSLAVAGTHPRLDKDKVYNTAVLYSDQGELLGSYDKMHLFSPMQEHRYLAPGPVMPSPVSTPWGQIGLVTCFDLRFPEPVRRLALAGANVILIPAYWPQPRLPHWSLLLRARALENQVFMAGCNRASDPGEREFGLSACIDPAGEVVAEAGFTELLLVTDIDLDRVTRIRKEFPVLSARRSGIYGNF